MQSISATIVRSLPGCPHASAASATIGGFIGGGSGGVGAINHGGLRDRGNIISARVLSCEEVPRVVTLIGDEVAGVNHAYGATGIITRLTIALAPVQPWIDILAGFDDFMTAARFCHAVASADGIGKKLLTTVAAPLPESFRGLEIPPGQSVVIAMIARQSLVGWDDLLRAAGGVELLRQDAAQAETTPGMIPLYEYTWNHTTLHMLRRDKGVTYLQCLFPAERSLELVAKMTADLEGELMQHLEFQRVGGRITCSALPVIRFSTPERLAEIVAYHEANGVLIANPHFYTLEDGAGHKRVGESQPAMKARMDPHGLLNPGKMRSYVAEMVQ
jgi:FAD/FMN-containing dehydrogenase